MYILRTSNHWLRSKQFLLQGARGLSSLPPPSKQKKLERVGSRAGNGGVGPTCDGTTQQ